MPKRCVACMRAGCLNCSHAKSRIRGGAREIGCLERFFTTGSFIDRSPIVSIPDAAPIVVNQDIQNQKDNSAHYTFDKNAYHPINIPIPVEIPRVIYQNDPSLVFIPNSSNIPSVIPVAPVAPVAPATVRSAPRPRAPTRLAVAKRAPRKRKTVIVTAPRRIPTRRATRKRAAPRRAVRAAPKRRAQATRAVRAAPKRRAPGRPRKSRK